MSSEPLTDDTWDDDEPVVPQPRSTEPARRPTSAPKRRSNDRARRSTIRATVTRTLRVAQAEEGVRTVCAALLGCDDDLEALAMAVCLNPRAGTGLEHVEDILAAGDDQFEAAIAATVVATNDAALASTWKLLHALELVDEEHPVTPVTAASKRIASAVLGMTDQDRDVLAGARELIEG